VPKFKEMVAKSYNLKTPIPGVEYMVVFKDTENNILGLIEENHAAKR
jgi:hypothetical protein